MDILQLRRRIRVYRVNNDQYLVLSAQPSCFGLSSSRRTYGRETSCFKAISKVGRDKYSSIPWYVVPLAPLYSPSHSPIGVVDSLKASAVWKQLGGSLRRNSDVLETWELQDFSGSLTDANLFLDACVMEALRLRPVFGLPFERIVPPGGITIGSRYFPGGTIIGMSPRITNRHRPTFGEDADEWRPERWLEDNERRRIMEQSLLTVLSTDFLFSHPTS